MRIPGSALLRACLFTSIPITAFAQTEPVVFEAESGSLGANIATGIDGAVTFVTTTVNRTTPPSAPHIATYSVTFPAAGNYELYARYSVGLGGATTDGPNDDSWYFGQGFGEKVPEQGNQWALQNEFNTGFTNPNATVLNGGNTGVNVFKWVKITGSQGPAAWVVPADALTQTFQFGTREDGMRMDKFAFGRAGVCYTVANLDNGQAATGTCPPPPPPEPPPYTRTEPPIAQGLDKYLGAAWSPGTASRGFANYWNQLTLENAGKWGSVEAQRDVMNWAAADEAIALAEANGMSFKWHALIWGNQQPAWIESLPVDEQRAEIREWFEAVAARYGNRIHQIEVVNEPLHDPPRGPTNGNYIEALGGDGATGWDWIITSFQWARELFPEAELLINDYSITNDGNATTRYIGIINLLKERGLIDAIGDQAHAFSTTEPAPMPNHRNNLDRLAATGLPIYITEFDLDGVFQGVLNHEVQLASYQRVFPVFWEHPAVKGVTIWGYVQGFHWRNQQGAWLLYQNGGERPALQWLIRYVQNAKAEVAPQTLTADESAAEGSVVGTVLATDTDAGTVFSQWQIHSDPSGKFVIDPATGTVSLAAGATLDFEMLTSHTITVSVFDGYRRSDPGTVTIEVTNANDNAPEILPGQSFDIDDGSRYTLGEVEAVDDDDANQPGFTTFGQWTVVGGTGASVFHVTSTGGELQIKRPLSIDFNRSSYTVIATVSDGANTSEPQTITIVIPRKVTLCLLGILQLEVPKEAARLLLRHGAALGSCKRYW
jgi:endo-1,4-beta-xylanase